MKQQQQQQLLCDKANSETEITLKGSVDIVSDFFFTAINSILYQRGTLEPVLLCMLECSLVALTNNHDPVSCCNTFCLASPYTRNLHAGNL